MTTRREFIKILTGTVVALSLPTGAFIPILRKGNISVPVYHDVEFTLEKIEILPLISLGGYMMRGLGVPKNKKIPPAFFAVRIDDKNNYDKKAVIEEIKFKLKHHFKEKLKYG